MRAGMLAASANQTASENRRLLQEAIQALEQKQDGQHQAVLEALARLEEQHVTDYLSLRHDLETAASVADSDLEQKSRLLTRLTATVLARTGPPYQ